jgi:thiamine biosynthesis lipoprotein
MGTVLEITVCSQSEVAHDAATTATMDVLFAIAFRLDALFSTFSSQSAISHLNAHAGQGNAVMPPEVIDLLTLSQRYWRLTQGTFDITVGPLLEVWKDAGQSQTLPLPVALQHARRRVGSAEIILRPGNRAALSHPSMKIDVGGIGKGYVLDHIASRLKAQGVGNALLDFGQSSLWALGTPPDASRWRLLLQRPNGQPVGAVSLHNQPLSISASFGQYFTIEGRQYGHIIDPRSGEPLQRDLLACVLAPDATLAEALSKALLILGETEGIALLEKLSGVEGMLVEANGGQWMTRGWKTATEFAPA